MKILYYIPKLDQSFGGIRQYAINLLGTMSSVLQSDDHVFVHHDNDDPLILDIISSKNNLSLVKSDQIDSYNTSNSRGLIFRIQSLATALLPKVPTKLKSKSAFRNFLDKKGIKIVYSPYPALPIKHSDYITISTLHDVQELHYPEFFTAEQRAARAQNYLEITRRADRVVVSYRHIKEDLIKYFQMDKDRVQVMLLNMGKLWFENMEPSPEIHDERRESRLSFLLYPANFWAHKNHIGLVKAFASVNSSTERPVRLVLTGNDQLPTAEKVKKLVDELGLSELVEFKGMVTDQELFDLYQDCLGVVVPTLYEAGSFPLMEAILMRRPVICSNVTSLPDTMDNDAFLFDPTDINSMVISIKSLIESEQFRNDSISNSIRVGSKLLNTGCENILGNMLNDINNKSID